MNKEEIKESLQLRDGTPALNEMGISFRPHKDSPYRIDGDHASTSYGGWFNFLTEFAPNWLAKYGPEHRDLCGIQNAGPIIPERRQELLDELLAHDTPDDLGNWLGQDAQPRKDLGVWRPFYDKLIKVLQSPDAYQG